MKTPHRSERGQSLVELAISIVVLLWLLAGAVEFGLGYFQFVQLRDAAQEGALYGSIDPTNTDEIEARVRAQSSSPVDLSDTTNVLINISTSGGGCVTDTITVDISYAHPVFMPFAELFTGGPTLTIRASVTDTILKSTC
jgi:Flp pilus assembly protein TadG